MKLSEQIVLSVVPVILVAVVVAGAVSESLGKAKEAYQIQQSVLDCRTKIYLNAKLASLAASDADKVCGKVSSFIGSR